MHHQSQTSIFFQSHAISIYLVQKYGKDDSLYPSDLTERTKVNERLFFESSFLFARLFEICVSWLIGMSDDLENSLTLFLQLRIPFVMVVKHRFQPTRSTGLFEATSRSKDSSSMETLMLLETK